MRGSVAMPSQGEAAFGQTPGIALLTRQPRVSQPVHPAGRGAGGVTGELQEGDDARILASYLNQTHFRTSLDSYSSAIGLERKSQVVRQ